MRKVGYKTEIIYIMVERKINTKKKSRHTNSFDETWKQMLRWEWLQKVQSNRRQLPLFNSGAQRPVLKVGQSSGGSAG